MNILGEKSLVAIVKRLLDLIFIGGIMIILSLPISLKWYLSYSYADPATKIYYFLLILLVITGVLALIIVNELRKIFNKLKGKNPFVLENVKSLKRMGIASFLISLAYIFKIIFLNSFMTIIVLMVFVIAGFFSVILAEVFRQAVQFKEDNDFTI